MGREVSGWKNSGNLLERPSRESLKRILKSAVAQVSNGIAYPLARPFFYLQLMRQGETEREQFLVQPRDPNL